MKRESVSLAIGLSGGWLANSPILGIFQGLVFYFFYEPGLVPPNADGATMMYFTLLARVRGKTIIQSLMKVGLGPTSELARRRLATAKHTKIREKCSEEIIELENFKIFVYRPENLESKGAVVYFHGGGFALGQVRFYRTFVSSIAVANSVTVICPEYRKAPENPYPTPVEDCYESALYIFENAGRFSIDPQNIIFTGDSAGGYMAVEVWYRMLVRSSKFQVTGIHLLYPALGGPLDTPSQIRNSRYPPLTFDAMAHFLLWFIGEEVSSWKINMIAKNECFDFTRLSDEQRSCVDPTKYLDDRELQNWKPKNNKECANLSGEKMELREKWSTLMIDPLFSPLIIPDSALKSFPKCIITVCDSDVLKNDGQIFHSRLQKNGRKSSISVLEGSIHSVVVFSHYFGFFPKGTFSKIDECVEKYHDDLRKLLNE